MDLRSLEGLRDSDSTWASGNGAEPTGRPDAESATAEPTRSGLSEVEADPGMAPYGDVTQSRSFPRNDAAEQALIPAADLLDGSTEADVPVASDVSSAGQGPVTSPGQVSVSPAEAAAEAQEPSTAAGDIQPAAPQQPVRDAPVPAAPGPRRALAEAADDAVLNAKVDAERGRNGSVQHRKAAGQLNHIRAAIAAVAAWEVARDEALERAERAHSSGGVSNDDPEVKACDAGLQAAKATRDQALVGTPLGRARAAERAVDDARGAWETAKQQQQQEIEAGKRHSESKLRELRQNTHASEQRYRLAVDAAVVESKAALHDAILTAKLAGADIENDPQVQGCRDRLETASVDRDWVLRDVLTRKDYYGDRIDQLLKG